MWSQFPHAHSASVTSLCFSPHVEMHSHLLCSTSGDETVALWDYYSGVNICRLRHHREPVNHALFAPDDQHLLFTASDDRSVALWDIRRTDRPLGSLQGFSEGVNKMVLLPFSCVPEGGLNMPGFGTASPTSPRPQYLMASACDDGMVYIHGIFPPSPDSVLDSPSGALNGNGDTEGSVGLLMDSFFASVSNINDLVLVPGTNILLTVSEDCALRIWRLLFAPEATSQERLLHNLEEFENPVNHVAIVPEGWMGSPVEQGGGSSAPPFRWALAASSEGVFGIALRAPSGEPDPDVKCFVGHSDYVRGIEFTSERTLLTVSDDSTAIEWALPSAEPIRQVKLHEGLVMASAMSVAGDALATGSDTGEIRVWRQPFHTERLTGASEAGAG